jgi:dUTP pyrophosphatase
MTLHNPNDAIRISVEEPVAQNTYKTSDRNWIDPKLPKAPNTLNIKFKLTNPHAKLPHAVRDGDIGFDLHCAEDVRVPARGLAKISTGVQLADMPLTDHASNCIFMKIEGRSGLASKGVYPVGGIIDPNYRGEIGVTLINHGPADAVFSAGDRIAQLVVYKVATAGEVVMSETDSVTDTNRGAAGFGSSGR